MTKENIFHITTSNCWEQAKQCGEYRAESLETEKFIHFSRPNQVLRVANLFYRGQKGLLLLQVDVKKLKARLVFESPVHKVKEFDEKERFPHLYGPLNIDAIVAVYDFAESAGGGFLMPAELRI